MDLTVLFSGLVDGVGAIGGALVDAFNSVSSIFYVATPTPSLTLVGWLLIAVLAIGLVRFALNTIFRLFTRIK